jgi:crossover junction endodeoxyribonuclease RusA
VSSSYTFRIEGRPLAKGRPRLTKSGRVYTPAATQKYENHVAVSYGGPDFGDALLSVDAAFYPTHTLVTISETDATKSTLNADVDNLVKALLDGLNGVAFTDDKQVHELSAVKLPRPTKDKK